MKQWKRKKKFVLWLKIDNNWNLIYYFSKTCEPENKNELVFSLIIDKKLIAYLIYHFLKTCELVNKKKASYLVDNSQLLISQLLAFCRHLKPWIRKNLVFWLMFDNNWYPIYYFLKTCEAVKKKKLSILVGNRQHLTLHLLHFEDVWESEQEKSWYFG